MRIKPAVIVLMISLWLVIPSLLLSIDQSYTQHASITQIKDHTTSQYETSQPIVIENNSDFLALGVSGSGVVDDPYVIENLKISSVESCITVRGTTAHFTIFDCILETVRSVESTILFDDVENGRVELCEIRDGYTGISILNSRFCSVENTSIFETSEGIYFYAVENCTIMNSQIVMNDRAVDFDISTYCQLTNNSIYSNWQHGLDLSFLSNNNSVLGNMIGWNGINALDYGEGNVFRGNAWSDFNGTSPYRLPGTSESIDTSPLLLLDLNPPNIVQLPDIGIDVETSGNSMTWEVSDEYPCSYSIQIDDLSYEVSVWIGDDITLSLDSLVIGTHAITLALFDGANNTAVDEVYVTVISFILGGIGTELVMIASGITVATFVVIVLLVKKLT